MTVNGFFNELKILRLSLPKPPLEIYQSEGCEFGNEIYNCKNLFYCFDCTKCTDSFYLFDCFVCASCGDCDYAVESELCWESVDPFKCFNCDFLEYCDNMRDSAFSYFCSNCHDVFGCVNLKNKSFCIFNRQLAEQDYREQVKKYKALPPQQVLQIVEDLKKQFPLTQTIGSENENTSFGNYIHFDKNCYLSFDAAHDENCGYLYDSFFCKSSYDLTYTATNVELSYQVVDSTDLFNCNFTVHSNFCQDSSYLFNCFGVKNSLGCAGLKNKEFCILNRQFTKEEYEKLSGFILGLLKQSNTNWADLAY